ncbi:hypothetical protein RSAG8_09464, partial [Rhizoctonia solani AG-8 WAC10335]
MSNCCISTYLTIILAKTKPSLLALVRIYGELRINYWRCNDSWVHRIMIGSET